ncbi:MAG: hypothetical protein ABSD96_22170 [Candidatus Korobacteraceae bacterium]|jgi:hypothetical protein
MPVREEIKKRIAEVVAKMADENYWPPAANAEEELCFALRFRIMEGRQILGETPEETRKDLIHSEKLGRLLSPMHPATRIQARSKQVADGLSPSEAKPQNPWPPQGFVSLLEQALHEVLDPQSPTGASEAQANGTARGPL